VTKVIETINNLFFNLTAGITPAVIFPVVTGFLLLLFFIYYIVVLRPKSGTTEWINMETDKGRSTFLLTRYPLEKQDIAPLVMFPVFFFLLAFVNNSYTSLTDVSYIGLLFGILILVVLYTFIKNIFGKTAVAVCGTLLLGFDLMLFSHSRAAAICIYEVFFILLAFFFIYRYASTDVDAPFKESLKPLALSGFFFGLGFAAGQAGLFAGAGIIIVLIIRIVLLGRHYKLNEKTGFGGYKAKTFLFFTLFFIVVPAVIYCLCYIPNGIFTGMSLRRGMLWDLTFYKQIWDGFTAGFPSGSRFVSIHPFTPVWWRWILGIRPVLQIDSMSSTITAISVIAVYGNPVLLWAGLPAMAVMAIRVFSHRDAAALFIITGFLSQIVPRVVETGSILAFYHLPVTLFLVLALAHVLNTMIERKRSMYRLFVYGYTSLAGILFAVFYPIMSGLSMPRWYFTDLLPWFPALWPF